MFTAYVTIILDWCVRSMRSLGAEDQREDWWEWCGFDLSRLGGIGYYESILLGTAALFLEGPGYLPAIERDHCDGG